MNRLIEDGPKIIELCQDMNHDEVIQCILNNSEIKNYIDRITMDKDLSMQVMHDTILSLIRSCMKKDFVFKKNPIAYVKAIAKYINYKSIKEHKKQASVNIDNQPLVVDAYMPNFELREIMQDLLHKISVDCKEVLLLWSMKYKMSEIADKLYYNSESYTKKKKHFCLKKLIKVVEGDLKFKKELRLYV